MKVPDEKSCLGVEIFLTPTNFKGVKLKFRDKKGVEMRSILSKMLFERW